jgi:hypothetical protein
MKHLADIEWLHIGTTDEYEGLKHDIATVCRDVTHASCIDEICINDIVRTFELHGYDVVATDRANPGPKLIGR